MKISIQKINSLYVAAIVKGLTRDAGISFDIDKGDTAKAACENASRRMICLAKRFELLSELYNPARSVAQSRINALTDEQVAVAVAVAVEFLHLVNSRAEGGEK